MGTGEERVGEGGAEDRGGELEQAGPGDEENPEEEKLLRVTDFPGEEEKKPAGDEDDREEVGSQTKEKKENSAEVGAGRTDEVGFGVLGGLGVEGEIAGVEGEEGQEEENSGAKDGQSDNLLTQAGSGASEF